MKRPSRRLVFKASGFSLIEILISITLLSFIAIGSIQVIENSTRVKDTTLSEDQENFSINNVFDKIEWDFTQVYTPLFYSNQKVENINSKWGISKVSPNKFQRNENYAFENQMGHPVPRFKNPDESTFEFLSTSNRRKIQNTKESNFNWVRYSLKPSTPEENQEEKVDKRKGLNKIVRQVNSNNPYVNTAIDWDQYKDQELLNHVSKLKFSFWDEGKKEYLSRIREVKGGENLLRSIKVEVFWINPEGEEEVFVKTFRTLWPKYKPDDLLKLQTEADGQKNNGPPNATPTPGSNL